MRSNIPITRGLRINFDPDEREELTQNTRTILGVMRGEVPLYREFGTDASIIDEPDTFAEALFTGAAFESIAEFEPRVDATNIDFTRETTGTDRAQGRYYPVVTIRRAEEEEEL